MLKRDISTVNILVASAGGMIGSGWLFSPYITAQIAGSNALICWIIVAICMLFIALPLCELGTMFPISGGMAIYPTLTHGQVVGFLYAWSTWLAYVVITPVEIQAILQYASHFFPLLTDNDHQGTSMMLSSLGYVVAIGIMIVIVALNTYGVKLLAEVNKYLSLIKFIIPIIAIVSLLHQSSFLNNIHISLSSRKDWVDVLSAMSAGGVIFAFAGFQNGLMLAGEVKNPQRDIPIGILGAVLVGFILYFMLEYSFLSAIPQKYLNHGWAALHYPGDSGPLVGLSLLLGLGVIATLLMIDAGFSPLGTTLVYTASTARIIYGMALNQQLPKVFLKLNRHKIPYMSLYLNLGVGILSFLPFPGWQKLVSFLSSVSILSYGVGPICLLAMRRLQPTMARPFNLILSGLIAHIAFYLCNLMLYWCGFEILWKLNVALLIGFLFHGFYKKFNFFNERMALYWFISYMLTLLLFSYVGSLAGIQVVAFPYDMLGLLPVSILFLHWSQRVLNKNIHLKQLSKVKERIVSHRVV